MKAVLVMCALATCSLARPADITVDVNAMPRVVFTGDSQTCGRVGAMDYPQMLSREMPVRVINTAVGGTNTRHLLDEVSGGVARVSEGEKEIKGTKVGWHAGPYPGQKVRLGSNEYTIDRIAVTDHAKGLVSLWITESANEDFEGEDHGIEPGWRVRVAEQEPDYVCFMYSVNDTGHTSEEFLANIDEMVRRTRALGAEPIFLSGVPLMDDVKGGSHPGHNSKVDTRVADLNYYCREHDIPFGDVYSTLMSLDQQSTSVWVDTVHPTTDGSAAIINALRAIFKRMGLADNPYFLRGYRAASFTTRPDEIAKLTPFAISQPDYTKDNRPVDALFDLEAIHTRDEYGLLASADGECVPGNGAVLLQFGVGETSGLDGARLELVARPQVNVSWFDWRTGQWCDLANEVGPINTTLPHAALKTGVNDGAIWFRLEADALQLDYAGLTLTGETKPFEPEAPRDRIKWPPEESLAWDDGPGNLIQNPAFAQSDGDVPLHWQRRGEGARYIAHGVVAEGVGAFVADKRIDQFRAEKADFTETVRALDMLQVSGGPGHATGNFLIRQVVDDQTVRVRRYPDEAVEGLRFQIIRGSGCLAAPGGCAVQCAKDGHWQQVVPNILPGRYRLSFFHRVYDPASMNAKDRPGKLARVSAGLNPQSPLVVFDDIEGSYQWQHATAEIVIPGTGELYIRLGARGETPVEYTGVTLRRL